MAGAPLDLSGDKKLLRQLQAMGKAAASKEVRSASRSSMKIMQKEAKRLAPRDKGTLRKNILLRSGKRSRSKFQHWVAWARRDKFDIDDDAKGYYPASMEYGNKKIKDKKKGRILPAQPHIGPAWTKKRKQIETRMSRSLKRIVLRAAKTQ
jgi:HK97 gp10 family phage protein